MQDIEIKSEAKEKLLQIIQAIENLSYDEYTQKIAILGNASIGGHTRHIIELFHQLLRGYDSGVVNYDDRQRDLRLQENIDFATDAIANIITDICIENKPLQLVTLYNHQTDHIETNYLRELMYNIEHCIHHQAIMKIGLMALDKFDGDEGFGVANSTIAFRKSCAQ